MTPTETKFMNHIKACAKDWKWTRSEVLASAHRYAEIDPDELSRLPELLEEEMAKQEKGRKG